MKNLPLPKPRERNASVTTLQQFLVLSGNLAPGKLIGGAKPYGPSTRKAVRDWQQDYWVDGVLDQVEWDIILDAIESSQSAANDEREFVSRLDGQSAVVDRYGRPWDDSDAWRRKWLGGCSLPPEYKHLGIKRMKLWVNKDIAPILESALIQIAAEGLACEIVSFDGSWNIRKIRGSTRSWSTHTWALSFDINAKTNGLGVKPTMHPRVVEIFEEHGFIWGGKFRRKDGMHFQYCSGM